MLTPIINQKATNFAAHAGIKALDSLIGWNHVIINNCNIMIMHAIATHINSVVNAKLF